MTGGGLFTVTVTSDELAVFASLSVAKAGSVWEPLGELSVFQEAL